MKCPACGTENRTRARFCDGCGTPIDAGQPSDRIAANPPTITRRTTSAHPTPIQGERKHVTVLFADVKGSMDLQEDLDPEEWANAMQALFGRLSECVRRYDGTVDKFTGDGLMAIFGAPVAQEDHAQRACRSALDMLAAVAADAAKRRGPDLHVRVGLNSGEVVVGGIGGDARMDYTAIGHTVGIAQRMESVASQDSVALSDSTARLVDGFFELRALGPHKLKGVRQPVPVHALVAAIEDRTRLRVATERGVASLVGREDEMAALREALTRSERGDAQVVGIVAEAGVGKSRLCEEFADTCQANGLAVYRTAAVSHAQDVPLLPALQLVRALFGIVATDDAGRTRSQVAAITGEAGLPLLLEFLEIADPATPALALSAEARMRRLVAALIDVMRSLSERAPLVLLLDDLHWLDPQSAAFFAQLLPSLQGIRSLVIANFRPEFDDAWMHRCSYSRVTLAPLAGDAAASLVAELLGEDPALDALSRLIVEQAGGNPFYMEEMCRVLVEDGTLVGSRGSYLPVRAVADVRVPPSVHAVLASRVDRLSHADKDVLQVASCIGRSFSVALLQAAAEGSDVPTSLEALCAAEFLQSCGDGEYRFWHPLTQEVAYTTLLLERRTRIHAHVARSLEWLLPERRDEQSALIADHWIKAGETLLGARWMSRAAEWVVRSDMRRALSGYRRVAELLETLPDSEQADELAALADARLIRWGARAGSGADEWNRRFERGRERAMRRGDVAALAHIIFAAGTAWMQAGDVEACRRLCREAVRIAETSPDVGLRAAMLVGAGYGAGWLGELREALDDSALAFELLNGDADAGTVYLGFSALVAHHLVSGQAATYAGDLREARHRLTECIGLAEARSDSQNLTWALSYLPLVAYLSGEGDELDAATRALDIAAETSEMPTLALQGLGVSHIAGGRAAEAVEVLEPAIGALKRGRAGRMAEASMAAYLALALLEAGRRGAAEDAARAAAALARERGQRHFQAVAEIVLGRAVASAAPLDHAEELIDATGAESWRPFVHAERARLGLDAGRERVRAAELFERMGATRRAEVMRR